MSHAGHRGIGSEKTDVRRTRSFCDQQYARTADGLGVRRATEEPDVDAVNGRIPALVDGGIRRGTDVFKALAIGADAVCIGRPYLWGLTAFGQPGVERVLEILDRELRIMMQQAGTPTLADITRNSLVGLTG